MRVTNALWFTTHTKLRQTSEYLWRKVFFVSAGLYFFTNLIYVIFGEGEKADWDNPSEDEIEQKKEDSSELEPMIKENTITLQQ